MGATGLGEREEVLERPSVHEDWVSRSGGGLFAVSLALCLCLGCVSKVGAYGICGLEEDKLENSEGRSRSPMPCVSRDNSRPAGI